jgi:hypothetical protein
MVLAVALAACGQQAHSSPAQREAAEPESVLHMAAETGLQLVSTTGDETVVTVPGGVASPDHDVLVSTETRSSETLVRRLDGHGTELSRWLVSGDVEARVVSPLGTSVALTERASSAPSTYAPTPRSSTRVVVARAEGPTLDLNLPGNFEPEAFSTDDEELFLLEYLPALAPTRYQVRRLILDKGDVLQIGRQKAAAPDQMQGTGRAQVYSPWGDELYTLYTQQESSGHEGAAFSGDHAFVHLLNLEGSWTHCIDLPHTFGHGEASASAITVSPDGSRLFVVDWSAGMIAEAAPQKLEVVRTAAVAFGDPDDRTFAAATDDLLYVAGGAEVVVVDARGLSVSARWTVPGEITGLTVSDDGSRLYVSSGGEVTTLDAADGEIVDTTSIGNGHGLTHVAPGS